MVAAFGFTRYRFGAVVLTLYMMGRSCERFVSRSRSSCPGSSFVHVKCSLLGHTPSCGSGGGGLRAAAVVVAAAIATRGRQAV